MWVPWVNHGVPGSAHKSCNLSPFPDIYLHTSSFSFYINPKASHLSWAQDIWCLKINITNQLKLQL